MARSLITKLLLTTGAALITLASASSSAQAATLLSTTEGNVGTVDPSTGIFTPQVTGPVFTDIALSKSSDLFGVTFGQLFNINVSTGSLSLIGNLGATLNSLGFSDADVLYGTGGSGLYQINQVTGAASLVASIPNFVSSGDIVFDSANQRFLATSLHGASDRLFSIGLDGAATQIGEIGFRDVYGLFFEQGKLWGYTRDRQQIIIDPTTGTGTFDKTVTGITGEIWGSASLAETDPKTSVPEPTSLLGLLGAALLGGRSALQRYQRT
ncbi:MAG: PEP-CTERM sorting domain-containing protein [Trichocoleus desertorum ATA4-8-CV12]|jgi:hypothetical protein|nr:PEP-CTERM sorting domain-containing protein [Trichocoleus desertorum ATA4-8-CV12]